MLTDRDPRTDLIGARVVMQNPSIPSARWTGRVIALVTEPSYVIETDDGTRMALNASWAKLDEARHVRAFEIKREDVLISAISHKPLSVTCVHEYRDPNQMRICLSDGSMLETDWDHLFEVQPKPQPEPEPKPFVPYKDTEFGSKLPDTLGGGEVLVEWWHVSENPSRYEYRIRNTGMSVYEESLPNYGACYGWRCSEHPAIFGGYPAQVGAQQRIADAWKHWVEEHMTANQKVAEGIV